MKNLDDLRPEGQDPDEFKPERRDALLLLGLHYIVEYHDAGCPFGKSVEGMFLWMRYGAVARAN